MKVSVRFMLIFSASLLFAEAIDGILINGRYTSNSQVVFNGSLITSLMARGKFACISLCLNKINCTETYFEEATGICNIYGVGGNGKFPPEEDAGQRYTVMGYCSQKSPTWNGYFINWSQTEILKIDPGTTAGYKCVKGSAFHSQDLVDGGYTATGKASDAERFGTVTLECKSNGSWAPLSSSFIPRCSDFLECKKTDSGKEYQGKLSVSWTGKTCLAWASQTLDNEPRLKDPYYFTMDPSSLDPGSNYCRNPLSRDDRPFCIVDNATSPRELCNVPYCEDPTRFECMWSRRGTDYLGEINKTRTGTPCDNWGSAGYIYRLPDNTSATMNKCRNPDGDSAPWCSTATAWGYCDIPYCPGYP